MTGTPTPSPTSTPFSARNPSPGDEFRTEKVEVGRGLPRLLVLTDRHRCHGDLVVTLAAVVAAGARAVVVREKDLPEADRSELAAEVGALLAPVGGVVILASGRLPPPAAAGRAQRGIHLAAADPPADVAEGILVGRSCHDADEVRRATDERADYVTVSPVHPTASKPGYGPALAADGLADLVAVAGCTPVYALGGVTPATVPACLAAGAHGVAVMGGIMGADDPGEAAAELVAAIAAATTRQGR